MVSLPHEHTALTSWNRKEGRKNDPTNQDLPHPARGVHDHHSLFKEW